MGRRNQDRKKRKSSEDDLSIGPITLRRRGTQVEWIGQATPNETARIHQNILKWRDEAPLKLREEANAFLKAAEEIDPLTLLGIVFFKNYGVPMLKGDAHQRSYAEIEHVALLLAKRQPSGKLQMISQTAGDVIFPYIEKHLHDAIMLAAPGPDDHSAWSDVLALLIMWEMGVRVPRFEHHQKDLLQCLFAPFSQALKELVGFDVFDALRVENYLSASLKNTIIESATLGAKWRADIDVALRNPEKVSEEVRSFIKLFAQLPVEDRRSHIIGALASWLGFRTGWSLSHSVKEVSENTNLPDEAVKCIMDELTVKQDALTDYFMAVPANPLLKHPLVQLSNRYVAVSPGLFLPALQFVFEDALKRSPYWERYNEHRANYAEERAAELFSRLLPAAEVFTNVKYSSAKGQRDEVDVMVIFDRRLFVIEVKSGGFAEAARQGIERRVEDTLNNLVFDAHKQANKAFSYIHSSEEASFSSHGAVFKVRRADFSKMHRVAITIEQIGHIVNGLNVAGSKAEHDRPWAVSLADLETIADILSPAEFLHYVERREALIASKVLIGADEQGFLEHYLHNSLTETYEGAAYDLVQIDPASPLIDAYEFAKGRGENVDAPQHKVHSGVTKLLNDLQYSGLKHWTDVALMLLNMPHKLQRAIGKTYEGLLKKRHSERLYAFRTNDRSDAIALAFGSAETSSIDDCANVALINLHEDGKISSIRFRSTTDATSHASCM